MSQSREDAYTDNPHEWNDSGYLMEHEWELEDDNEDEEERVWIDLIWNNR